MTSRFFATGDTSDEESEKEEEEVRETAEVAAPTSKQYFDSSDEEEEQQRVVRSEKDKRFEQMKSIIKSLKNSQKINDWVNIAVHFDRLVNELDKAKKVVQAEGIPNFYFKAVCDLEAFLKDTVGNKEAKNKLNKPNTVALGKMRQKLLKHNRAYEKQLEKYLKDPDKDKEPEKEVSKNKQEEEDEEEETPKKEKKTKVKKTTKKKKEEDDEEDEDDDFQDDDSDSSSDSDIDITQPSMFDRKFWEKKPKDIERERRRAQKKEQDKQRKEQDKDVSAQERQETEQRRLARVAEKKAQKAQKQDKKEVELTPEAIEKKLKEIKKARGRRATNHKEILTELRVIHEKSPRGVILLKVQITLISALFETSLNRGTHMLVEYWKESLKLLDSVITALVENPNVRLSEDNEEVEEKEKVGDDAMQKAIGDLIGAADKKDDKKDQKQKTEKKEEDDSKIEYVIGNLYSFIHRLCAEFTKSLRYIDHHTPDYLSRLRDEQSLIAIVARAQEYYQRIGKDTFVCRVILRRMELTYYHYDPKLDVQKKEAKDRKADTKSWDIISVEELAQYLYKRGAGRDRTRAVLYHTYHLAIHNKFAEARDLLLMTHVQDNINEHDIKTRILFNRSMAQIGLCAFRVGEFGRALTSLAEFYPSNRIKELLAQGISRNYNDRNIEKEKEERRRQYPFHMHMNIDMIEAFHLVSAMFEEVPNMAIYSSNRRRIISKTFRHHFTHYTRQAFNGPPENTRDGVMAATAALQEADWRRCLRLLFELKVWEYVPNAEVVKATLKKKVQEVALRTYLLSYAPQYATISPKTLAITFELDVKYIHKVVSEMIMSEQLQGAWDQSAENIIMYSTPPSRLQKAALSFAEKATLFVEQNERLMDQRNGYYAKDHHRERWQDFSQARSGGRLPLKGARTIPPATY